MADPSTLTAARDELVPEPRPEFRLLLACAIPECNASEMDALLQGAFDWEYALTIASWHGMLPLLGKHLSRVAAVPEGVRERLAEYTRMNVQRNLRLSAELVTVSDALESRGIGHIVYKGPVLGEQLYGSLGLRSCSDLDLIVHSRDGDEAINCLAEMGYSDGYGLTPKQQAAALRHGFEFSFWRGDVVVDLHWRVVQNHVWSLPEDELWRGVIPYSFGGRTLQVFSPEVMLAVLSVHAAQHDWVYLKLFADIARLLEKNPGIDWNKVERLVTDSHARRSLYVSLKLVNSQLCTELPARARDAIEGDPQVAKVAAEVVSKMWLSATDPFPAPADFGWLMRRTKGERFRDRLRYLAGFTLAPTLADFQMAGLPQQLDWFYFALRPFRIAIKRLKR